MIILIIPVLALFSLFSVNGAALIKASCIAKATQTLESLQPFFTHLKKERNLPLKVAVVNASDLDISFEETKTTALVTIKQEVLCDFAPEIIEVVIAARVARWMSLTQTQKNILSACQNVAFAGSAVAALSSLFIAHEWLNTRTLAFGQREKYAATGLTLVGSTLLIKLILEWHIKDTEEKLTKDFIFTPKAHAFLASLSADSHALLASQEDLRFLFEKFAKAI